VSPLVVFAITISPLAAVNDPDRQYTAATNDTPVHALDLTVPPR